MRRRELEVGERTALRDMDELSGLAPSDGLGLRPAERGEVLAAHV